MLKKGFLQALSVAVYCSAVGLAIWNVENLFDGKPNFFGPVAFLLLFSVSALTCSLLVFYQPYILFFDKKKKEAIDLVVATTVWLFAFFLIAILLALLI